MNKKGLVGIITGDGKGKTTSAIGQAIRSAGWNRKIIFIQFFKKQITGELKVFESIDQIIVKRFGSKKLIDFRKPSRETIKEIKKGWQVAEEAIVSNNYNLVVLDEINLAIKYGLINKNSVIELINNKPKELDLILTGRGASKKIVALADFVSEIKPIKHHFDQGIKARKGIEY
jgi:cob(I)alamin adenosyltransferase